MSTHSVTLPRRSLLPRRLPRGAALAGASVLLGLAMALSLAVGPTGVTFAGIGHALRMPFGGEPTPEAVVFLKIRLPRMLLGVFVGAALTTSGTVMQGLFRNPLADPGLIGVSSGAALAAVATIALGNSFAQPLMRIAGPYALPVTACLGGLAATTFLIALARRAGMLDIGTVLLAGIAFAALCGALTGLMAYVSDDRELRDLTLWSLGSLAGSTWVKVLGLLPFAAATLFMAPRLARALNGLLLGEAEAFHLGIDVEKAKRQCIAITAMATGPAVAVAGIIGFVGIVVPHLVRLVVGPDHRAVLPIGALAGSALVLIADVVARMAVKPAELPLGIVLAVIGAPVFLRLVIRTRSGSR